MAAIVPDFIWSRQPVSIEWPQKTDGDPRVAVCFKPAGLQDIQQLDFEYQCRVGRDGTGTTGTVGQIVRDV